MDLEHLLQKRTFPHVILANPSAQPHLPRAALAIKQYPPQFRRVIPRDNELGIEAKFIESIKEKDSQDERLSLSPEKGLKGLTNLARSHFSFKNGSCQMASSNAIENQRGPEITKNQSFMNIWMRGSKHQINYDLQGSEREWESNKKSNLSNGGSLRKNQHPYLVSNFGSRQQISNNGYSMRNLSAVWEHPSFPQQPMRTNNYFDKGRFSIQQIGIPRFEPVKDHPNQMASLKRIKPNLAWKDIENQPKEQHLEIQNTLLTEFLTKQRVEDSAKEQIKYPEYYSGLLLDEPSTAQKEKIDNRLKSFLEDIQAKDSQRFENLKRLLLSLFMTGTVDTQMGELDSDEYMILRAIVHRKFKQTLRPK